MSQDIIVIQKDPYVDDFYEMISERKEAEQEIMKVGYGIGRYTDLELKFEYDDNGHVIVVCSQTLRIQSLFSDILGAWK